LEIATIATFDGDEGQPLIWPTSCASIETTRRSPEIRAWCRGYKFFAKTDHWVGRKVRYSPEESWTNNAQ